MLARGSAGSDDSDDSDDSDQCTLPSTYIIMIRNLIQGVWTSRRRTPLALWELMLIANSLSYEIKGIITS